MWRVQITRPNGCVRYFGRFSSATRARDWIANASNRVVDVLGKFVAHRLADFVVTFARKVVCKCKTLKIWHGFKIPDEDICFPGSPVYVPFASLHTLARIDGNNWHKVAEREYTKK